MATRTYYMLIDIKRDIFEIIKIKPVDTGNVIYIKFSEDGKPVNLTGKTVRFMAKKPDGTGVYNFARVVNATAGEVEVTITNQMTAVDGELDCEIEIEGSKLITTMTFYITVDKKINDGTFIESTNEFTVLQKTIRDAYTAIELMETKTDNKLAQVQTQVNTAISNMNSTTTTKLSQLQSQINTAIEEMNGTTNTKLADLQKQVTTAISSMNSKAETKLSQVQSQADTKLAQVQSQADTKLTAIQGQVNTLSSTLTKKVNDKITEVSATQTTLVNKVDGKVADIQAQFDTLETELTDTVDSKKSELTSAVTTKINEHTATINSKVTEVNNKIKEHTNTINSKVTEVNNKISAVNTKITEVNTTVSNANSTVNTLKKNVETAIAGIDTKMDSKLATKADKSHTHTSLQATSLSGQTISLNTLNLKSGSPHVAHYYCSTDGGGSGITGRPNDGAKQAFSLKVELIRWASTTDYISKQTYIRGNEKVIYIRYCTNDTWTAWEKVYTSNVKPSPADIGASPSNHNHDSAYLGKTAKATSATVADSANAVAWNNVSGKPSTFTPATHNHDSSYLQLTGGTVSGDILSTGMFTARTGNADVSLRFLNNVPSIRYGGTGAGSTNGFNIVGSGDNVKLRVDENGELFARGTQKVYHAGNKPTPEEIGASKSDHTHNYLPISGGSRLVVGTASSTSSADAQLEILAPNSGTPRLTFHSSGRSRMSIGAISGDMLQFTTERSGTYRIANANGYVDIGTQNTSYAHYNTDRPNHWFNTTVRVNGEIYAGSNYSQRVYHTGYKPSPADIGASDTNHNHDTAYLGKTAKAESAKTADAVAWGNVSGKPSTFTPASHNHDSSYLKLSGGTMSGKITTGHNTSTYLQGNQGNAIINTTTSAGSYVMLHRYPSTNGFFTMGGYQGKYLLQYTNKATVDAGTNGVTRTVTLLDEAGNSNFAGTVTAPHINITDNNGYKHSSLGAGDNHVIGVSSGIVYLGNPQAKTQIEANVNPTVKVGGTVHTMYHTGNKPSPADIGASASNHTHSNYLSTSGGTLSGAVKFSTATIGASANSNTLQISGTNDAGMGGIKLGTGGCRIYGKGDAGLLFVEGGMFTNDTLQTAGALITGAYKNANSDATNGWARIVRGYNDNVGSLKVQVGGTNTSASFEVVNPNWSTAWFSCGNTGIRSNSYSNFSDINLKTNIEETKKISNKMNKIGVYTYNYLSDFNSDVSTCSGEAKLCDNMPEKRWGVIAQEIEELFPELIIEAETLIDGENKLVKSVDVYGLTVLTLEYAKELEAENLKLKLAMAEMSEQNDEEILDLKLAIAELVEGGI